MEEPRDTGVAILLATHFMEEAERLADRLALIVERFVMGRAVPPSQ